jgi:putative ABC transport system substrate-binding protein
MTTLASALEQSKARPDALVVVGEPFLISQRVRISQYKLPSAYSYREAVEVGGLIAYATNFQDLFRRAAGYVDKISQGR